MNDSPPLTFARTVRNRLEALGRAAEEATDFLQQHGVSGGAVYAANLVIEELGTNILKYGYDDSDDHEILLRLEIGEGHVLVTLEDDGHEFNPLLSPEPDLSLGVEDRQPGGLGITLARQFAEHMHYERLNGRNRVTLRLKQ